MHIYYGVDYNGGCKYAAFLKSNQTRRHLEFLKHPNAIQLDYVYYLFASDSSIHLSTQIPLGTHLPNAIIEIYLNDALKSLIYEFSCFFSGPHIEYCMVRSG